MKRVRAAGVLLILASIVAILIASGKIQQMATNPPLYVFALTMLPPLAGLYVGILFLLVEGGHRS